MAIRQYKSDKNDLLEEGKRLVRRTEDTKFQHKIESVNLVLAGLPVSRLSELSGDSVNAITLWVKKADESGFESLRAKKQTGRPTKLTDAQVQLIQQAVEDDSEKYGYACWDGPALSDYIQKTFAVSLGVRQCQRLFHQMGFSLIRPQTFPCPNKESPDREGFKKN